VGIPDAVEIGPVESCRAPSETSPAISRRDAPAIHVCRAAPQPM